MTEPSTMPPPSTRSSSSIAVVTGSPCSVPISPMRVGPGRNDGAIGEETFAEQERVFEALVGIAIGEGKISGVDADTFTLFPDHHDKLAPEKSAPPPELAVATGVETAAQREALRSIGCDTAQGYLFAPPLTADGVAELLAVRV